MSDKGREGKWMSTYDMQMWQTILLFLWRRLPLSKTWLKLIKDDDIIFKKDIFE